VTRVAGSQAATGVVAVAFVLLVFVFMVPSPYVRLAVLVRPPLTPRTAGTIIDTQLRVFLMIAKASQLPGRRLLDTTITKVAGHSPG